MHFYPRIKTFREETTETQEQIADLLCITREKYDKYETGRLEIPMHLLIILANHYNVSLDYLTGLTDTPRKLR